MSETDYQRHKTTEREMGSETESPMNIYQRINEVRKKVEYIQKDASVQGYRAVTHDAVTALVRQHLIDNCIVIVPEVRKSRTEVVGQTQNNNPIYRYEAKFVIHFVNGDKPEDRISLRTEAHANDTGDKAPGKAISYATKYAILKLFNIETGENEESRTESYAPPIADIPAHKVQVFGGKYDGMPLGKIATTAGRAGLGYVMWAANQHPNPEMREKATEVWEKHRPDLSNVQVSDELQDLDSLEELTGLYRCLSEVQSDEFKDQFNARREELKAELPQRTPENARA